MKNETQFIKKKQYDFTPSRAGREGSDDMRGKKEHL
jgi:hypothetical protein